MAANKYSRGRIVLRGKYDTVLGVSGHCRPSCLATPVIVTEMSALASASYFSSDNLVWFWKLLF